MLEILKMTANENGTSCGFGSLFSRNVNHILENIFLSLDTESLGRCHEVCQAWKTFLTSESFQKRKSQHHIKMWMDTETLKHRD